MKIRIREYKDLTDRESVVSLWQSVFGYETAHNEPNLAIDKKLALFDGLFFIAFRAENEIIGSIMAGYDGHRGWIYSLAVSAEYRNAGIGTKLLRHAEEALENRGCLKINLQVKREKDSVVEFYQSNGYAVEEIVSMGKRLLEPVSSKGRRR